MLAAEPQAERRRADAERLPPGAGQADVGEARSGAVRRSAESGQALRLLCLFHLNLAFSSLEEASQAEVIRRCYRPALELTYACGFPIALEATGWTLRRVAQLDPGWIELLRELLAAGRVEFVGSAHAQCAAPLLPARVNAWNLRLGREVYMELLGVAPRIALVCEQVYSPGLVPLYLRAGYEALIVDWDNSRRSHPRWPAEHRLHPQRALGGGHCIPILWSKSIAFQKFQRFAHGELTLERYLDYVRGIADGDGIDAGRGEAAAMAPARALMLYANDVEIFDHRPGRFAAEPDLREGEWQRIAEGLRALRERGVGTPALPSEVLDLLDAPGAGHELELESVSQPIPVKKQDKYNVSRWAVSGRDDIGVNTRCWRLYQQLSGEERTDPGRWRELCELWASDFRTHITQARWDAYLARLGAVEQEWLATPSS
jgi:Glycosyl hydrolase family 57